MATLDVHVEVPMTRRFSIAEARNRLPSLVLQVEEGSTIALTRRGKPVAMLISLARFERLSRPRKGLWAAIMEFRRTHDLAALNVDEVFDGVRDRSPGGEVRW
jgi:prevent-host-death family protein